MRVLLVTIATGLWLLMNPTPLVQGVEPVRVSASQDGGVQGFNPWNFEELSRLETYEVVTPVRVDSEGSPLPSHTHYIHKRSTDHTLATINNPHYNTRTNRYQVQAFGLDFHLDLEPNPDFIAPQVYVEHIGQNGRHSWIKNRTELGAHCFHSGSVLNDPGSEATLSLCHHMMGTIKAYNEHLVIQPHPNTTGDLLYDISQKPHIIYRLSDIMLQGDHNDTGCGVPQENYKRERWKPYNFTNSTEETRDNYSSYKNSSSHHRHKRSSSRERNVEVMVASDYKMYEFHKEGLEHYILILMSIVANVYRHPSIGNLVNIVVVKIFIEKDPYSQAGLGAIVSSNAVQTLQNFCRWQQSQNHQIQSSVHHHDTAVLVTRQDLCRQKDRCVTLGLAEFGTICDEKRSCSISEDHGIGVAFTIAHEIGHLFGMYHDNVPECRRHMTAKEIKTGIYNIMAPTLDFNVQWHWSACSRNTITEFLDAGKGECLNNEPTHQQLEYTRKISQMEEESRYGIQPGEIYSVHKQCEQSIGRGSHFCPFKSGTDICSNLWCTPNENDHLGGCLTQNMPWADGTKCSDRYDKWCQRGECVDKQVKKKPVDGGWSEWYSWADCSRTCGGGVQRSERMCENPKPENGGAYCAGERVRYRSCNTQECAPGSSTFRETQCSNYNKQHFSINGLNETVQWVPKYDGVSLQNMCELYCQVKGGNAYYKLAKRVLDGTKCNMDTSDICVNGECRRAGCDNVLGSDTQLDRCGVCGGDNFSCRTIQKYFNEKTHFGYNRVATIPNGATGLEVRQRGYNNSSDDNNFLALSRTHNGATEWILNGHLKVSTFAKVLKVEGATINYSGSGTATERLDARRTIGENVTIHVLSVGKLWPPDIVYRYSISENKENTRERVMWSRGKFSGCDRICNGIRRMTSLCITITDKVVVSDQRCEEQGLPRPIEKAKRCNVHCHVDWTYKKVGSCSATCGRGKQRMVSTCAKLRKNRGSNDVRIRKELSDDHCEKTRGKPSDMIIPCNGNCPYASWDYGKWSPCINRNGAGLQRRSAVCRDKNGRKVEIERCGAKSLQDRRSCAMWSAGDWSQCPVTCGSSWSRRRVWCKKDGKEVERKECMSVEEPKMYKRCQKGPCPMWSTGIWAQCSVSCGKGTQSRTVRCRDERGKTLDGSECNMSRKPEMDKPCELVSCSSAPATEVWTSSLKGERTQWRTGRWTMCSKTCGLGTRERYVSCRNKEGRIAEDSECKETPKPSSKEECMVTPCGEWRTWGWSTCSASCGQGVQKRFVACVTIQTESGQVLQSSSDCRSSEKPVTTRACQIKACFENEVDEDSLRTNRVVQVGIWRTGVWGGCSSSCEGGYQRRAVACQDSSGRLVNTCEESTRPKDIQRCNTGPCPVWNYGNWGQCSVSCGSGTQYRRVVCQIPTGASRTLPDQSCDIIERPPTHQACDAGPCPTGPHWRRSHWSECSVSCGKGGSKHRKVTCVDGKGRPLDESKCPGSKPNETKKCKGGKCPRWHSTKWSRCSETCGDGTRTRTVSCVKNTHTRVNPKLCEHMNQPVEKEKCNLGECLQFQWRATPWSKCSNSCGFGEMSRRIACVDTMMNRTVSYNFCSDKKPKKKQRCAETPCPYVWSTKDWSPCSKPCGYGRSKRQVYCRDLEGKIQDIHNCDKALKPKGSKTCYAGPCQASTCAQLKKVTSLKKDGEYGLMVNGTIIDVYCHNMAKRSPAEYITLKELDNFAEVYGKRLRKANTCPADGGRIRNVTSCRGCFKNDYMKAGLTRFQKLRFNPSTLEVYTNDYKFSYSNRGGKNIPFASAGDCYSTKRRCPQGVFKVDLQGTGLSIAASVEWKDYGHKVYTSISQYKDGQKVSGRCGGHCGGCTPKKQHKLQLQIAP